MCGIIGYTGKNQAQPVLVKSLLRLEYRGYDSCGIAVNNAAISIYKNSGRVDELSGKMPQFHGRTGIGHTRWATHGKPSAENAHPHTDCSGKIALVHNGVINNYETLKNSLAAEGHNFTSETDTEALVHLTEKYFKGDLETAAEHALTGIQGSYAVIFMLAGENKLVFARKDSPLVLGIGDGENFIASDVTALLPYTNRVIYLQDGDTGTLTENNITIKNGGKTVIRPEHRLNRDAEDAQKSGYEHYMLKEIHEQPSVLRESLAGLFAAGGPDYLCGDLYNNNKNLLILGTGTSYHAALAAKYILERWTDFDVRVEIASEFNSYYRIPSYPLTIGITQSGETADTLKAMRRCKREGGSRVIALTNTAGSTAGAVADCTLDTHAGPEISVAATKSFTAQLIALYGLALRNANLETVVQNTLTRELRLLPDKIESVLSLESRIREEAEKLADYEHIFYIGRGINYPTALEGALKMKEVSYIHSEAFAAGEIKHGTFALLNENTPVAAVLSRDESYDAMITNIKEIKARGSQILLICPQSDGAAEGLGDSTIYVPATEPVLSPFINTVVMQLLAYYAALKRGCSIDFPRNLAKSVTVE